MNTIIISGVIGKDLQIIDTPKGQFGKFSLGVSDNFKNQNGDWEKSHTNWFFCYVTKDQIQIYADLLKAKNVIGVIGKLQIKEKNNVYYTSVAVKQIFDKTQTIENNKKVKEFIENLNKPYEYEQEPKNYRVAEVEDEEVPF